MSLSIIREIAAAFRRATSTIIMPDECTDVSNKEQFTICIRWVDKNWFDHEDITGLYNVEAIDANCMVAAIRDVLLRTGL